MVVAVGGHLLVVVMGGIVAGFFTATEAAAVAVLVRVLVGGFGDPASMGLYTGWTPVILLLAVATMVYGNLAALAQTSVKRMLAYSSISQGGFMLMPLAFATSPTSSMALPRVDEV